MGKTIFRALQILIFVAVSYDYLPVLRAPWQGSFKQWVALAAVALWAWAILRWGAIFYRGGPTALKAAWMAEAKAPDLSPRQENLTLALVAAGGLAVIGLMYFIRGG